jgi:selenocysteine lyase/cysteine desulfurase
LAHKSLGTEKTGIVRLSLSPFNSKEDVEKVIEVLQQIGG